VQPEAAPHATEVMPLAMSPRPPSLLSTAALVLLGTLPGAHAAHLTCDSLTTLDNAFQAVQAVCCGGGVAPHLRGACGADGTRMAGLPTTCGSTACARMVADVTTSCADLFERLPWLSSTQAALAAVGASCAGVHRPAATLVLAGGRGDAPVPACPARTLVESATPGGRYGVQQQLTLEAPVGWVVDLRIDALLLPTSVCGYENDRSEAQTCSGQPPCDNSGDYVRVYDGRDTELTTPELTTTRLRLPGHNFSSTGRWLTVMMSSEYRGHAPELLSAAVSCRCTSAAVCCPGAPGACSVHGQCVAPSAATVPPPSPGGGHRRRAQSSQQQCSASNFQVRSADINLACCGSQSGENDRCSGGVPSSCDARCAAAFLPVVDECRGTMEQLLLSAKLRHLEAQCTARVGNCACSAGWIGARCEVDACPLTMWRWNQTRARASRREGRRHTCWPPSPVNFTYPDSASGRTRPTMTPTDRVLGTGTLVTGPETWGQTGGVLLSDGRVVLVPDNRFAVVLYDPASNVVTTRPLVGTCTGACHLHQPSY
jgi:hypothetical protein